MNNKAFYLYLGALLLGLFLALTSIVQPGRMADLPASAAASVNGELISNERYSQALTRFENDSREPVSDADAKWVLNRLIDEQLLIQRATELNLVASSASIRSAVLDELIAKLTRNARANTISDEELKNWYGKNTALFQPDPRFSIQVFRFQDETRAAEANTHELAQSKGRKLDVPAGLLPIRKILDYAGAIVAKRITDLSPNSLSEPFRSNSRWTRVYVLERDDQGAMAFEGNESAIRFEWQRQQADQALRSYLEKPAQERCHTASNRRRLVRPKILLMLLLFAASCELQAHTRSEAWSEWQLNGNSVSAEITLSAQDLTRFVSDGSSNAEQDLATRIARQFTVNGKNESCAFFGAQSLLAATGYKKFLVSYQCKEKPYAVRIGLMLGTVPGHVHVVRYGQNLEFEQVLTTSAADIVFEQGARQADLLPLFYSGFIHILNGADHLAFLLGLLLITASLAQRVWVISGFTLGHSLSLALSTGGWVQTIDARVEATIGFTVLLTGAVYLARRSKHPWPLTLATVASLGAASVVAIAVGTAGTEALLLLVGLALVATGFIGLDLNFKARENTVSLVLLSSVFGLIHGFGFAGFLTLSGISGPALIAPVLSFNLGVEAGQLCLLAAALILSALAKKLFTSTWLEASARVVAAVLVVVGAFWLFTRSAQL